MSELEATNWQRELADHKAELAARFDAVGRGLTAAFNADPAFGGGWTYEASTSADGSVDLYQGGHRRPYVHIWHQRAHLKGAAGRRLRVEARHPADYTGPDVPHISVGMDRPVAAMAAAIGRRFLPVYLDTVDRALHDVRLAEERRRARVVLNREIAAIIPDVVGVGGTLLAREPDRTTSYWSRTGAADERTPGAAVSGLIRMDQLAQSARLEFTNVPRDLALAILRMVRPRDVLLGVPLPSELTPARPELPAPPQTVRGMVIRTAETPDCP